MAQRIAKRISPVMRSMTPWPRKPVDEAKKRFKAAEARLWVAYIAKRCDERRNDLWLHYQALVRYLAERLKSKLPACVDVNDLVGFGNVGLREAIEKFEPKRGLNFQTYCVPRIRGAMLDSIRAMDWVPRLIRSRASKRGHMFTQLRGKLKRDPTDEELARALKMSTKDLRVLESESETKAQLSFETMKLPGASQSDSEPLDIMEVFDAKRGRERSEVEPGEEIREIALRGLSEKERFVIDAYYFRDMPMKAIGKAMGLSESRICQIHLRVMPILRRKFESYRLTK